MKTCDIIIPAHNNAAVIKKTLTAIFSQAVPALWSFRLVIIDDGSTDSTLSLAQTILPPATWRPGCYLKQTAAGASTARNRGLQQAINNQSDIVLFLGADIILLPGALAAHCRFHGTHPLINCAALGHVGWDPRFLPTPLMAWLAHGGPQNDYDALLGQNQIDARHFFYGSHLSLKTRACPSPLFSPDFTSYGWEDLDAGRRLHAQGLSLFYLPKAQGLHHHYYSARDVFRRQYLSGLSLPVYQNHFPNVQLLPHRPFWHRWLHLTFRYSGLLYLVGILTVLLSNRFTLPRLFFLVTTAHFWQGLYTPSTNNRLSHK